MTKKIFNSIFTTAIAVFLVSLILIGGVLYSYIGNAQKKALAEQANIVTAEFEENGENYLNAFSSETYRITLISSDGTVLFDSVKNPGDLNNHADREEIKEAIESGTGESERYSETLLEKTYYCAKKTSTGDIVRISVTKSSALTFIVGLLQPIAAVLIIAFILSLILSYRLSGRIVKPLEQLDLEHPLENDTYDELSGVLSKIEKQRKDLVERSAELSQKKDEFSAVIENMNEGLILVSADNKVLSINNAAEKILSVTDNCIGKNIITVSRAQEFLSTIEKAAGGKSADNILNISGGVYQINATPVKINEKSIGICILIFDITDKNLSEQIRREFTANVSHELKTPLHSIMGSAELLKNGMVKPGDEAHFFEKIYSEAARLVTLVEDIIRLSQLDEGVASQTEIVDLLAISEETKYSLNEQAKLKNVTVNVVGENVTVSSVKRLVYEIIYNLTDNAIRYNKENGSVSIEVSKTEQGAVLTVSDTGIGVPKDSINRIFERFYRVDKSHSRETGGTGLGLSIVKHAAEYLGAQIKIESTLGVGTTIEVHFN